MTTEKIPVRAQSSSAAPLAVNLVAVGLLFAQYLLGMAVNLFVAIPDHHPGAHAPDFFTGIAAAIAWAIPSGPLWLAAHVTLGLTLAAAALTNLAWAPRVGGKLYTAASTLAALAIIGAAFNGASFLDYSHQVSSMIMAGLWALALACYLTCLVASLRQPSPH
jgi:hypothetical protein